MLTHKGTQLLRTERLVLRQFTMDDVGAAYENWCRDPAVTEYLSWDPHADMEVTRGILAGWVEQYGRDTFYIWAVTLGGEPIGSLGAVNGSSRDEWAEIGYCIGRAYWGQGIMTEALHRVLAFFFEEVGMHRICLKYDEANIGSGRVMVKNGLTLEGTLRKEHRRRDGTWGDHLVYGILAEEWEAQKGCGRHLNHELGEAQRHDGPRAGKQKAKRRKGDIPFPI